MNSTPILIYFIFCILSAIGYEFIHSAIHSCNILFITISEYVNATFYQHRRCYHLQSRDSLHKFRSCIVYHAVENIYQVSQGITKKGKIHFDTLNKGKILIKVSSYSQKTISHSFMVYAIMIQIRFNLGNGILSRQFIPVLMFIMQLQYSLVVYASFLCMPMSSFITAI